VLIDEISGDQIKVGRTCLGHCGISVPRKRRKKKEIQSNEVKNDTPIVAPTVAPSLQNDSIADLD
jgi:hypothetical protein